MGGGKIWGLLDIPYLEDMECLKKNDFFECGIQFSAELLQQNVERLQQLMDLFINNTAAHYIRELALPDAQCEVRKVK
ncbi:hypothetical protein AGMMS49525_05120 [Bacteroidia bacterium]|nr:hypothetical protein AGMMS49525_05120 [Bacteroidia bacterium]